MSKKSKRSAKARKRLREAKKQIKEQDELVTKKPLIQQFDDEWCLLTPDGEKDVCFPTQEEAEAAARKQALEESDIQEQAMTGAGGEDGHTHPVAELDAEGNGMTGPGGADGHVHEIKGGEVQEMNGHVHAMPEPEAEPAPEQMPPAASEAHRRKKKYSESATPFSRWSGVEGRFAEAGPQDVSGKIWTVVMLEEGVSKNNRVYTREILGDIVQRGIFEGIPSFGFIFRTPEGNLLDHAPDGVDTQDFAKDVAGFFKNVRLEEGSNGKAAIVGDFHFVDDVLREKFMEAWKGGNKNLFGFSIDAIGEGQNIGADTFEIKYIVRANSTDLVSQPAAGGRFLRVAASVFKKGLLRENEPMNKTFLIKMIQEIKPALLEQVNLETVTEGELLKMIKENDEFAEARKTLSGIGGQLSGDETPATATSTPAAADPQAVSNLVNEAVETKLKEARHPEMVEAAIKEAGLPEIAASYVREKAKKSKGNAAHITACVNEAQKLVESSGWTQPRLGSVKVGDGPTEKFKRAIESSIKGGALPGAAPAFSNFRHAVQSISGTVDWKSKDLMRILAATMGRVCAQWNDYRDGNEDTKPLTESYMQDLGQHMQRGSFGRIRETINLAQLTELFGDSITRQLIADYTLPALNDWRAIVSKISNLNDLRTNRRIRKGQYGDAATVAEGGNYLAATSTTDEEVTYTLTKRGDVETITEEAMLADDLGALTDVPRRMVRGLMQQLRKIVWDLIDPSVNPNIFDGNPLFQLAGAHINAIANTLDLATLNDTRRLMRSQTAFGGATHELSTVPKIICVPNELENTANQFSSSQFEPSSNLFQVANLHRGYQVIVLDHWTDADAFVVVADPSQIPTIEVGSIDGKIEPELFTQDDPTVGSMFDSDTVSIKRKSRFGAVTLDWRGFAAGIPDLV